MHKPQPLQGLGLSIHRAIEAKSPGVPAAGDNHAVVFPSGACSDGEALERLYHHGDIPLAQITVTQLTFLHNSAAWSSAIHHPHSTPPQPEMSRARVTAIEVVTEQLLGGFWTQDCHCGLQRLGGVHTSLRPHVQQRPSASPMTLWQAAAPEAIHFTLMPCIKNISSEHLTMNESFLLMSRYTFLNMQWLCPIEYPSSRN